MKNSIALSFLSLTLLLSAQPTNDSYISLDKNKSALVEVVLQISEWDKDQNSPLIMLKRYIQEGGSIGLQDAVLNALEYADELITRQSQERTVPQVVIDSIGGNLNSVIDAIINGTLIINPNTESKTWNHEEDALREQVLKVREKLYVLDRAKFFETVEMKKGLDVDGTLDVHGKLRVHGVAKIDDLSVVDGAVIGCDLTVGCNISINDSIDQTIGNVIKNGVPFIHNFGGGENTFVGKFAGNFTMIGDGNTGLGFSALASDTTGFSNTAVGLAALSANNTGVLNTATGAFCLTSNTQGSVNTASGYAALASNTTGSNNTAIGFFTLLNNTTGFNNTAIGTIAMIDQSTGNGNTAIGAAAMIHNQSGTGNIAIGHNAGNNITTSESNDIYIGNAGIVTESNTIRIGTTGTQTKAFIAGISGVTTGLAAIPVLVDGNGQLGTISSSSRFKHDIADMNDDSAKIYDLHPVTFAYNHDASETRQYGLIAEEVAQAFPALVVADENGQPYTVHYEILPVLLLNEVQKLAERVAILETRL